MSTVSKNLKKIRVLKGLTQEDIANKLFVTRQTVSNWENGKSQPDLDMLIKIADTFETDITTLIYDVSVPVPQKREIRKLIIWSVITFIMSIIIYNFHKYANISKEQNFNISPILFLQMYMLPVFWMMVGWILMQGLGALRILKPIKAKYSKVIHITILAVVIAYGIIMLPFLVNVIINMIQSYHYHHNPDLFPNGYSYSYSFLCPGFVAKLEYYCMRSIGARPGIFFFTTIIYWFTKSISNKEQRKGIEKEQKE